MKTKLACLILSCLLLSGCGLLGERIKEPVNFYYTRTQYEYFSPDGVIVSEQREGAGHSEDLSYLLALYLMGPAQEELSSPLPSGTKVYMVTETEDGLLIQLSSLDESLSDIQFSLAGACMGLTCFDLTDAQTITINSGERSVMLTRDNILQYTGGESAPEETQ